MGARPVTEREIKRSKPGTVIADDRVIGLRLRHRKAGRVWEVRYRDKYGRRQQCRLGDHPTLSLAAARKAAQAILGRVAEGENPAEDRRARRAEWTVADLLQEALVQHWRAVAKESTLREVVRLIDVELVPALGTRRLGELTPEIVQRWHRGFTSHGTANRALAALSKACSLAVRWGLMSANPCRTVERYRERKLERYLTDDEYRQLLAAIDRARSIEDPFALACVGLLVLTGWRRGEAVALRWDDVSLEHARVYLRDAKTGSRHAVLSPPAVQLLADLPRVNECCFPQHRYGGEVLDRNPVSIHPDTISKLWARLRDDANLPGVRLHDLRHSYASLLARQGYSLPIIGALLGHRTPATTARYAHLAADDQRAAADGAASAIVSLKK